MNGIFFFLIRNWKVPQRKIEQLTYCHPKLKRRTSASIYLSGRWRIYSRTSTASGNFSEFSPLTSSFQFSMGATDKGRAAAIAILQRTDTFKDLQYSRNCLSDMLLFLSALGVHVQ